MLRREIRAFRSLRKQPAVVIYDADGRIGRFEHRIREACEQAGVGFILERVQ